MLWKRGKKYQLLTQPRKKKFLWKKISKLKLSNGEETEDPKLPNVINANQIGYIKGRLIGENVRLISDIIN